MSRTAGWEGLLKTAAFSLWERRFSLPERE
jgi:hypothetical protein